MIISHDKTLNELSFTLDDPDFGVTRQTGTISINCCETSDIEILPVFVRSIEVPLTFMTGAYVAVKFTINSVEYTCTDNSCSSIAPAVRAVYPDFLIASTNTASAYNYTIQGLAPTVPVVFQATINGVNVFPVVKVLPTVFRLAGDYTTNGIYSITVTKNIAATNEFPARIISESACFFLDYDVVCALTEYISKEENKKSDIHILYSAIKESVACGCNCKDLCLIYRSILLELNLLDRCTIC